MFARMAVLLSLCVGVAAGAEAQTHRSIIRGTVLDGTGPAANVPMRATHEATGEIRRFVSDDRGVFTLVQVEPGIYRFESEDDRYRTFAARVSVSMNDELTLQLPLTAASISAEVDFRSFVLEVERHSPNLRTRLPGDFLAGLPLDGRSLFDAVALAPRLAGSPGGPFAPGLFPPTYTIDGFSNRGPGGAPAVRPQIESVWQFEAGLPFFDAAFAGGGPQINVLTRSGTNSASGGAFAFLQTAEDRQQLGAFGGGPITRDRLFVFADVGHSRFSDEVPWRDSGTDAGIRVDSNIGASGRVTARYALSDAIYFGQRGQLFGGALRQPVLRGSNDLRFSLTTTRAAQQIGLPDATRLWIADTFAWAIGDHALDAGGQWLREDLDSIGDRPGQALSGFVQDEWRAAPTLSIQAGLRVEWMDPPPDLAEQRTHVLPRVGFAWQRRENDETVIRGGYGRFADPRLLFAGAPALDQWTIGAARQWSRTRTIEIAYEGARLRDASRSHALVFEMEQRSEVGLTGHVAYTFGVTDLEGDDPRDPEDRQHELTGAFTWVLPFGDERLLFNDGVLRDIFEEMQLTGVFAVSNVQTDPLTGRRGDFRTLDVGLLKDLRLGANVLQLRFETFNLMNRPNRRGFFYPELPGLIPVDEGRRYQVGLRWLY